MTALGWRTRRATFVLAVAAATIYGGSKPTPHTPTPWGRILVFCETGNPAAFWARPIGGVIVVPSVGRKSASNEEFQK